MAAQADIWKADLGLGLSLVLLVASATIPTDARADLMIELEPIDRQPTRLLVQPPRVRLEMADQRYRLYDAELDAMVSVFPEYGVFYEEDLAALERERAAFLKDLRQNREAIEERVARAPEGVRARWREMVAQWRLDEASDAPGSPRAEIDSIDERNAEEARAGGFRCTVNRIELAGRDEQMRACLADPEDMGIDRSDLDTLAAMFDYLERQRMVAGPVPDDAPGLPPGLIAELIERTGQMVLGAARWKGEDEGTGWVVTALWSARLEPSRFAVEDAYRHVQPPYGR
ncbi:MAG: hypothetical protein U5K73_04355 [Halofilum sp. (in: g-proteobacteria)]|nr:hypothetical protein [Halofilum sp. (in: g-proteobacteria)]